jgi:hypothetical protein
MTVVLVVSVLILMAAGVWSTHRRIELRAWDRELAAAFAADDRPEVRRHQAL